MLRKGQPFRDKQKIKENAQKSEKVKSKFFFPDVERFNEFVTNGIVGYKACYSLFEKCKKKRKKNPSGLFYSVTHFTRLFGSSICNTIKLFLNVEHIGNVTFKKAVQ